MDDERFDQLIDGARDTYRVPSAPPLDEMWAGIDAELGSIHETGSPAAAELRAQRMAIPWRLTGLAAAALVLGVGLGRWSATRAAPPRSAAAGENALASASQVSLLSEPLHRTTTDYLGETAAMLKQFESDSRGTYAAQATTLLATTRLLLDSPAATDAHLHELLEDLELILAQIAALRSQGSHTPQLQEMQMIRSALRERDVVPRVHTAAVTLASSDD